MCFAFILPFPLSVFVAVTCPVLLYVLCYLQGSIYKFIDLACIRAQCTSWTQTLALRGKFHYIVKEIDLIHTGCCVDEIIFLLILASKPLLLHTEELYYIYYIIYYKITMALPTVIIGTKLFILKLEQVVSVQLYLLN